MRPQIRIEHNGYSANMRIESDDLRTISISELAARSLREAHDAFIDQQCEAILDSLRLLAAAAGDYPHTVGGRDDSPATTSIDQMPTISADADSESNLVVNDDYSDLTPVIVSHTFERSDFRLLRERRHEVVGAGTRLEFDATELRRKNRLARWIQRRAVARFPGAKRLAIAPPWFDFWYDPSRRLNYLRVSIEIAEVPPIPATTKSETKRVVDVHYEGC